MKIGDGIRGRRVEVTGSGPVEALCGSGEALALILPHRNHPSQQPHHRNGQEHHQSSHHLILSSSSSIIPSMISMVSITSIIFMTILNFIHLLILCYCRRWWTFVPFMFSFKRHNTTTGRGYSIQEHCEDVGGKGWP